MNDPQKSNTSCPDVRASNIARESRGGSTRPGSSPSTPDSTSKGVPTPKGSLRPALAEMGDRAALHEVFDAAGARLYDDCYGLDPDEITALRTAVRRTQGPILELAAGNGRLTLPLLQMGREVTALDISEGMLDRLRERSAPLRERIRSRLHVCLGDMTDIRLPAGVPQKYELIVLLLASLSILDREQRVATLCSARSVLSAEGIIIISLVLFRSPVDTEADYVHTIPGRSGAHYRIHEVREAGSNVRQVSLYPVVDDGEEKIPVAIGEHHVLSRSEMEAEFAEAGLRIVSERAAESPDQGLAEVFIELQSV